MERLQKIIADRSPLSRRKADELIRAGRVTLNGRVAVLGDKAGPADIVCLDGKPLRTVPPKVYLLMNKPRGVLCTAHDPEGRPTVLDLARCQERLYPVGRLDMSSTGLVILTNDGDLAHAVTHHGSECPKVYRVKVSGHPDEHALNRLRRGLTIEGVRYAPCRIEVVRTKPHAYSWLQVTLHEGKNRQIRRMFEAFGQTVFQLRRVAIGPVTDAGLPVGAIRPLTDREVRQLKSPGASGGRRAAGPRPGPPPTPTGGPHV